MSQLGYNGWTREYEALADFRTLAVGVQRKPTDPDFAKSYFASTIMVVGETGVGDDRTMSMMVDKNGVAINTTVGNRKEQGTYSLLCGGDIRIEGNIEVVGDVVFTQGRYKGGVSGIQAGYWQAVESTTTSKVYSPSLVTIGPLDWAEYTSHRFHVVGNATFSKDRLQFAVNNREGSGMIMGMMGDSSDSPCIIVPRRTTRLEIYGGYQLAYLEASYDSVDGRPTYAAAEPALAVTEDGNLALNGHEVQDIRWFQTFLTPEGYVRESVQRKPEIQVYGALASDVVLVKDRDNRYRNLRELFLEVDEEKAQIFAAKNIDNTSDLVGGKWNYPAQNTQLNIRVNSGNRNEFRYYDDTNSALNVFGDVEIRGGALHVDTLHAERVVSSEIDINEKEIRLNKIVSNEYKYIDGTGLERSIMFVDSNANTDGLLFDNSWNVISTQGEWSVFMDRLHTPYRPTFGDWTMLNGTDDAPSAHGEERQITALHHGVVTAFNYSKRGDPLELRDPDNPGVRGDNDVRYPTVCMVYYAQDPTNIDPNTGELYVPRQYEAHLGHMVWTDDQDINEGALVMSTYHRNKTESNTAAIRAPILFYPESPEAVVEKDLTGHNATLSLYAGQVGVNMDSANALGSHALAVNGTIYARSGFHDGSGLMRAFSEKETEIDGGARVVGLDLDRFTDANEQMYVGIGGSFEYGTTLKVTGSIKVTDHFLDKDGKKIGGWSVDESTIENQIKGKVETFRRTGIGISPVSTLDVRSVDRSTTQIHMHVGMYDAGTSIRMDGRDGRYAQLHMNDTFRITVNDEDLFQVTDTQLSFTRELNARVIRAPQAEPLRMIGDVEITGKLVAHTLEAFVYNKRFVEEGTGYLGFSTVTGLDTTDLHPVPDGTILMETRAGIEIRHVKPVIIKSNPSFSEGSSIYGLNVMQGTTDVARFCNMYGPSRVRFEGGTREGGYSFFDVVTEKGKAQMRFDDKDVMSFEFDQSKSTVKIGSGMETEHAVLHVDGGDSTYTGVLALSTNDDLASHIMFHGKRAEGTVEYRWDLNFNDQSMAYVYRDPESIEYNYSDTTARVFEVYNDSRLHMSKKPISDVLRDEYEFILSSREGKLIVVSEEEDKPKAGVYIKTTANQDFGDSGSKATCDYAWVCYGNNEPGEGDQVYYERDVNGNITKVFGALTLEASRLAANVQVMRVEPEIGPGSADIFRVNVLTDMTVTGRCNANGGFYINDMQVITENHGGDIVIGGKLEVDNQMQAKEFWLDRNEDVVLNPTPGFEAIYQDQPGELKIRVNNEESIVFNSGGATLQGEFVATGNIVAYSDERVKKDIRTVEDALQKVKGMRGVTFRRKTESDDAPRSVGLIAQDVLAQVPEAVSDVGGTLSVAYGNLVGVLVEAVKELSARVESLESQLAASR